MTRLQLLLTALCLNTSSALLAGFGGSRLYRCAKHIRTHVYHMGLFDGLKREVSSRGDPLVSLAMEGKQMLAAYGERVTRINGLEAGVETLTDSELRGKTSAFRARIRAGDSPNDVLEDAFACVREASYRVLGLRHFDVQLLGGMAMSDGCVCEMATGEGKTLVALLVAYLYALTGKGSVCVCTVNDYLARRDADNMGQVLRFLDLSVDCIQSYMDPSARRNAYDCDITYTPHQELGFDYLRDQLVTRKEDIVLRRPLYVCLIDEFDSVCVDDARTPLVISQPQQAPSSKIATAMKIINLLLRKVHYEVDEKAQKISLTEIGYKECEGLLGGSLFDPANPWAPFLINAIKAKELFTKDKEYIIRDGKLAIVDSSSGRILEGRRYTDGLQQAIEVKEQLTPSSQTQVIAKITYPYLLKQFQVVAGMTGTAWSEALFFLQTYKMKTIRIPTALPVARKDYPDVIFKTVAGKLKAVVKEVKRAHASGRPILVGTRSVDVSETLSAMIKDEIGVAPAVLNARPESAEREGVVVAQAGYPGSVLVSTNMGGRGTDILLGGNSKQLVTALTRYLIEHRAGVSATEQLPFPQSSDQLTQFALALSLRVPLNVSDASAEALLAAVDSAATARSQAFEGIDPKSARMQIFDVVSTAAETSPSDDAVVNGLRNAMRLCVQEINVAVKEARELVKKAGGLYVIGTEKHESVRIDQQLRGRAGRQGDPGASRFLISMEDDIFRVFGGDKMKGLLDSFRVSEDLPIESTLVVSSLNSVQQSVERYLFEVRNQVQEWDDIISAQRDDLYSRRSEILLASDQDCVRIFKGFCDATVRDIVLAQTVNGEIKVDKISSLVSQFFPSVSTDSISASKLRQFNSAELISRLASLAQAATDTKMAKLNAVKAALGPASARYLMLIQIDNQWGMHLSAVESLKDEVYLRRYKGTNPLEEFMTDSLKAYNEMWNNIKRNTVYSVMVYNPESSVAK